MRKLGIQERNKNTFEGCEIKIVKSESNKNVKNLEKTVCLQRKINSVPLQLNSHALALNFRFPDVLPEQVE